MNVWQDIKKRGWVFDSSLLYKTVLSIIEHSIPTFAELHAVNPDQSWLKLYISHPPTSHIQNMPRGAPVPFGYHGSSPWEMHFWLFLGKTSLYISFSSTFTTGDKQLDSYFAHTFS